jgi:hypothetical protein
MGCCCIPERVVVGVVCNCFVVGCNCFVVGCNCFEVAPGCIHCSLAGSGC